MNQEHDAEVPQLYRDVLRIEKEWWKIARTREAAIGIVLGISPMKYYLVLSELLDNPNFWAIDPVLVDRLRSLRDRRLEERGSLNETKPQVETLGKHHEANNIKELFS
ncbi:DUF3263 domain-containing protein [Arcanobacterium ihumii]|uniref:DUF3263 domain-containing protein n=1 Tax=Arcanobacterium ihumii TaxID=2138162 RepID=UPI000F54A58C|nr:DUF3263 domain-containing protein [Arcanobacterium ihumii]